METPSSFTCNCFRKARAAEHDQADYYLRDPSREKQAERIIQE